MDNIYIALSKRYKELRQEKGLTQIQLADTLHLARQTIAKFENGSALPETAVLKNMCILFDCEIEYLINPDMKFKKRESADINSITGLKETTINLLHRKNDFSKVVDYWGLLFNNNFELANCLISEITDYLETDYKRKQDSSLKILSIIESLNDMKHVRNDSRKNATKPLF